MTAEEYNVGAAICGGENMTWLRRRTQLSALGLEMRGIRMKGGSTYAKVKREYGWVGNRARIYDLLRQLVEETRPDCLR